MVKFHELWNPKKGTGISADAALQQAQAFVRSQEEWKHPYYQAARVLGGLPWPAAAAPAVLQIRISGMDRGENALPYASYSSRYFESVARKTTCGPSSRYQDTRHRRGTRTPAICSWS